jgi:hypothetical protein
MFEKTVLMLASKVNKLPSPRSLVEVSLDEEEIEDIIRSIRSPQISYKLMTWSKFQELQKYQITTKGGFGLLFLSYIVFHCWDRVAWSSLWPAIYKSLEDESALENSLVEEFFIKSSKYPNKNLIECIGQACKEFDLRNAFSHKEEQQYLRNTVLLQIGLLNDYTDIGLWLSGWGVPITVNLLWERESENYSSSFRSGWSALRRFQQGVLSSESLKKELSLNYNALKNQHTTPQPFIFTSHAAACVASR